MSEQNRVLERHELQDTQGAGAHGPNINPSVSNVHSRLIAAALEMGELRHAGLGEPDKTSEAEPPDSKAFGRSLMEDEIPEQRARNRVVAQRLDELDPWKHRSQHMRCRTCMYWVPKVPLDKPDPELLTHSQLGRCRRHAPTMGGYPATYDADWCGDHKMDETKI